MELPRGEMDVVASEIVVFEPHQEYADDQGHFDEAHHDPSDHDEGDISFDPQALEAGGLPWDAAGDAGTETGAAQAHRGAAAAAAMAGPLATAADLHDETQPVEHGAFSPEVFHQNMIVRHPEYGLGKIVALSGSGDRRSATVAFASSAGQRKFMLAKSPLRPAKSG